MEKQTKKFTLTKILNKASEYNYYIYAKILLYRVSKKKNYFPHSVGLYIIGSSIESNGRII